MNIIMALPPTASADAEKHVVNLSDELLHRGHAVYILADLLNRDSETEHIPFTFEFSGLPGMIRNAFALHRLVKDVNANLIHVHAPDRVAHRAARMKGIPLVTTLHDGGIASSLQKSASACGDRVFAAWEQIKTKAVEGGGMASDEIEIAHIGIDPDYFSPRAFRKNAPRPIITLLGNLAGDEGGIALKLMQEVFEYDKYHVRVIGTDRLPADYAEFENHIELIGTDEDTRTYLAETDVVIASGSAAIEALMMGRPVVAVGGGCAVGLVDEDNIASAIACAFGDIDCRNRAGLDYDVLKDDIQRGMAMKYVSDEVHEFILKEFNLKGAADRMERIYEELTDGGRE